MRNQVQLITYADRLAGTIRGLSSLLRGPLAGLFGGVHLLPFYTPIDGVDAGYDPTDHTEVDFRLGTWATSRSSPASSTWSPTSSRSTSRPPRRSSRTSCCGRGLAVRGDVPHARPHLPGRRDRGRPPPPPPAAAGASADRHEQQRAVAERVNRVYDHALGPLPLHSLFTGDATALRRWFAVRPDNTVTVLDTHDGISVPDVGRHTARPDRPGLLDDPAVDALVERIHANTDDQSRRASGTAASNIDVHQVNSTYDDALARDDDAYLLARAVQLFTPGVPQIYYVGLLAGTNDMELLEASGVGRDINRHRYTPGELVRALEQPVVRRLTSLIRFRNRSPAFAGSCRTHHVGDTDLRIRWQAGAHAATLTADLAERTVAIAIDRDGTRRTVHDLADLAEALGHE